MNKVSFTVNGEPYILSGTDVSARTTLNDFLRSHLELFGTKVMCRQGFCGACVVSVSRAHPSNGEKKKQAVNSCLIPILSCHEWDITTIEGIGDRRKGYHTIQKRLAEYNGTQCGYCSPGWVMGMYSLQASSKALDAYSVERCFAGHTCRCTGYRPILDALKSFAKDKETNKQLQDVEELDKLACVQASTSPSPPVSGEWCIVDSAAGSNSQMLEIDIQAKKDPTVRWYKPYTIEDIFKIETREGAAHCRLVAGNTASGLYPTDSEQSKIAIDISSVAELQAITRDQNLMVGAGCTLMEVEAAFRTHAEQSQEFEYLRFVADHLRKIANTTVRNVGTIGGNLGIKCLHPDFPSDVAVLLDTVGATITVIDNGKVQEARDVSVTDFLSPGSLTGKLVTKIKLPPLGCGYMLRTYKQMPRAQSATALVNAGFLFQTEGDDNKVKSASIVFGNMGPGNARACLTEKALIDKPLFHDATLKEALRVLKNELAPVPSDGDVSVAFKKLLATSLLYKAILSLAPATSVSSRYQSGGAPVTRGVSSGQQHFSTETDMYPLTQPVNKLEGLVQCAGEARYACDVPLGPRALYAAFALADNGPATIGNIDTKSALAMKGVKGVLTAKDIPGRNTFVPLTIEGMEEEPILADKETLYEGQPIAIVVAEDRDLAQRAAAAINVSYKDCHKPVLTIEEAICAPDKNTRVRQDVIVEAKDHGNDVTHCIEGTYSIPGQYHYTLETQSCCCWPTERGVRLRSATQWMDLVQIAVADTLGLQHSQVEVESGPVGGGYGGKASRSALAACACAAAAGKLHRAVQLVAPLDVNMRAIGTRQQCLVNYKVQTNASGEIQSAEVTYYSDCGCSYNDTAGGFIAEIMEVLYDTSRWKITGYSVRTDTPSTTWCRAPGTTEANAIMEHIFERISHTARVDSLELRLRHVKCEHETQVKELVDLLKKSSDWDARQACISEFNAQNAWKKRSLCMTLMGFPVEYGGAFPVTVSVYHADGTVLVGHGGVEMGQGINTKIAQVIAHELGIPLSTVQVRQSDTFVSPNAMATNGSITSECVANAAIKACAELKKRIDAAQDDEENCGWLEKVRKAYEKDVNLQAVDMTGSGDALGQYSVCGVCAMEVELDALTAARVIRRCDIIEDTGRTLSPHIDIGQIEGALIMGLGLWGIAGERLRRDPRTGRLLTATAAEYVPPGPLDIPVDLRITLHNPQGKDDVGPVLRSKATGEPALLLAVGLTHALRVCVEQARTEFGHCDPDDWLHIDTPCDVENVLMALSPKEESFKLK